MKSRIESGCTVGVLAFAILMSSVSFAHASEYGVSSYRPGSMDLFSGFSAKPGTTMVKTYFLYQDASTDPVTADGKFVANSHLITYTNAVFAAHSTRLRVLGAYWGMGVIVQTHVVDQTLRLGPVGYAVPAQRLTIGGLGDLELLPEILAWSWGRFHLLQTMTVYAPTGSYDPNRIANTGLNRWAIEPDLGLTWLDEETGQHASLFLGYTVNSDNTATHYHSGQEFHADFALAQHLPHGLVLGASGYALQQTTADSGTGAVFGPRIGRVLALGPLVGETFHLASLPITLTAKYDFEFATANSFTGNELWLSAALQF